MVMVPGIGRGDSDRNGERGKQWGAGFLMWDVKFLKSWFSYVGCEVFKVSLAFPSQENNIH